MVTSRVLDSQVLGEETTPGTEASSYTIDVFGDIINCTLTTAEDNRVLGGTQGGTTKGHLPSKIVNLKVTPSGTITFHPHDLKFMKYVISDYAEGGGNYTMANDTAANSKSLSIKGNFDDTDGIRHLGVYLTNVRFSLPDEDILTITADLVSLFSDTINEVVSYSAPSGDPLTYVNGVMTFDAVEWDLQSFNFTYNPKMIQKFGMKSKSTNKKRYPTSIIKGGKTDMPFDGVANSTSLTNELRAMQGGTSVADSKSNSTLILTLEDNNGDSHVITMTGQTNKSDVLQTDSEENSKTIAFGGNLIDLSIVGVL